MVWGARTEQTQSLPDPRRRPRPRHARQTDPTEIQALALAAEAGRSRRTLTRYRNANPIWKSRALHRLAVAARGYRHGGCRLCLEGAQPAIREDAHREGAARKATPAARPPGPGQDREIPPSLDQPDLHLRRRRDRAGGRAVGDQPQRASRRRRGTEDVASLP